MSSIALGLGAISAGCLTRPINACAPTTKTNFQTNIKQTVVDKVDLLFAIDNSQSMGDKQSLLKQAVPDLIRRLLYPACVNENDPTKIVAKESTLDANGDAVCPAGSKAEFPPVHDLHVAMITSSIGGMGGTECSPDALVGANKRIAATLNRHNDDKGELINRGGADEHPVANMDPSNFLAWFPNNKKNATHTPPAKPITDDKVFDAAFADMIDGVHEYGCGYEATLESVYRFLVQPDPYKSVVRPGAVSELKQASLDGYDETLLKQRRDFLRPDSLVAVVMLTDENHSAVDPRAFNGRGWRYADGSPLKSGTAVCATAPTDPKCSSCYIQGTESDPGCKQYNVNDDNANVRMFDMKRRFGVDPRPPVQRYIDGFTKAKVPRREEEHAVDANGNLADYPIGGGSCTNPLFAAGPLPASSGEELCKLPTGLRTSDQVFFALIGGVPWQLLTTDVKDDSVDITTVSKTAVYKDKLDDGDWRRILGSDPARYNFDGQNIFMQESIKKRAGIKDGNSVNTREWETAAGDLQYACTFDLPATLVRDCPSAEDQACACGGTTDSPLCDATVKTKQIRAKAYPTIEELRVVKGLGEQGIVSSICPRDLSDTNSENYGYRPAVKSIIDRLKNALANQCLPQKLEPKPGTTEYPCLVLEQLKDPTDDCAALGRTVPDASVLKTYRDQQKVDLGDELAQQQLQYPVCVIPQLPSDKLIDGSCEKSDGVGWCYLEKSPALKPGAIGTCQQALKFTEAASRSGSKIKLQCIEKAPVPPETNPDPNKPVATDCVNPNLK